MNDDLEGESPSEKPAAPRGRAAGVAAAAVIVAVIALALAAWSTWRVQRMTRADAATQTRNAAAVASLEDRLTANDRQDEADNRKIDAATADVDALHTSMQGVDSRLANLETAYSNLSGQQQSGRDTLLLNDAELLLRAGQQRYELFHDSAGALKAYTQAIAVLAQVQNPALAPVRASATTERDALAAAAPPARQAALDTLSTLRGEVASLPLAAADGEPDAAPETSRKPGFWSRVAGALGGIVKVSREGGTGTPLAEPRFARQTLALDLAQAQEALLAFDSTAYRAALQRADAALAAQFDSHDANVQAARARLATLLAQHPSRPPPQLGGALAQLESLRANAPTNLPPPVPAISGSSSP